MSIGLYIVLAPLYLKSVRKLQEKRFVFVKILAIIIPENGAKVSKIKCFQFAQQTLINQQQLGLDSKLGSFSENSNNLSGGQWQKIALARAAYRNQGRIIILDEPTSALDPMAEAQLYKDFAEITGDKTTILISHRLGITSVVDRILVFRDGKLIEDGSHQELMEKDGYYAKMYRAQAKWYQ